jgi:hypothetical protein
VGKAGYGGKPQRQFLKSKPVGKSLHLGYKKLVRVRDSNLDRIESWKISKAKRVSPLRLSPERRSFNLLAWKSYDSGCPKLGFLGLELKRFEKL